MTLATSASFQRELKGIYATIKTDAIEQDGIERNCDTSRSLKNKAKFEGGLSVIAVGAGVGVLAAAAAATAGIAAGVFLLLVGICLAVKAYRSHKAAGHQDIVMTHQKKYAEIRDNQHLTSIQNLAVKKLVKPQQTNNGFFSSLVG